MRHVLHATHIGMNGRTDAVLNCQLASQFNHLIGDIQCPHLGASEGKPDRGVALTAANVQNSFPFQIAQMREQVPVL